jgi:hypothetical protein
LGEFSTNPADVDGDPLYIIDLGFMVVFDYKDFDIRQVCVALSH